MSKKKDIFILLLWGIIFSCIVLAMEYMGGDSWKNQYMPVRITMMQGYINDISQGVFPQIEKSGNCDHAIGFYILASFIGSTLDFNAVETFRAFTLFFSITMLIILMLFIYYFYRNLIIAFIVPILGYIFFEDYLFRVKNDVYVAVGIWMVVVAIPILILLCRTKDIKRRLLFYVILVFIISISNIAREHTSLGLLLCFLISGIKDVLECIKSKKAWTEIVLVCGIMLMGVLGYNFCASGLPNILLEMSGQSKWLTTSTAWHNIYIGFGYFDNPYNIVYLDECAVATVESYNKDIIYPSNEYFEACKELVLNLVKTDFVFCCISLIKKAIWIVGGIGIVTVRRMLRVFVIGLEVIYLLRGKKEIIPRDFIKENLFIIIYIVIIGLVGLIPSILTAPNIIYSITSYAMVQIIIMFVFLKICAEKIIRIK